MILQYQDRLRDCDAQHVSVLRCRLHLLLSISWLPAVLSHHPEEERHERHIHDAARILEGLRHHARCAALGRSWLVP